MSLAKGDHLRIQRNGRLIEPEEEAYHEFEVLGSIEVGEITDGVSPKSKYDFTEGKIAYSYYDVRIKIVK